MEIDSTKPHIGRVYDYVLGGHHNFEVDRQMAAKIMEVIPSYPKWARLNRWFLQLVAEQWAAEGRKSILDLASGLPTQGHMHEYLPNARILYSDNDPLSVTYGQQLLEQVPHASYIFADLKQPEHLLAAATAFFGDERQVAIDFIGISYLIDDTSLAHLAQMLHDWCVPGSILAASFLQISDQAEHQEQITTTKQHFSSTGANVVSRTPEQFAAIMAPWRVIDTKSLPDWLGIANPLTDADPDRNYATMFGSTLKY